jgi:hypothetical protein
MSESNNDTTLRHARRETMFVVAVWAVALVWTLSVSFWRGLDPDPKDLHYGIPGWVWLGVLLPWLICTLVTIYFCLHIVSDDDLGEERPEANDV